MARSPEGLAVATAVSLAGSAPASPEAAEVARGGAAVAASETELYAEAVLIQSASRALNAAANHGVIVQPMLADDACEEVGPEAAELEAAGLEAAGLESTLEAAAHLVAAALDEVLAAATPGYSIISTPWQS